MGAYMHLPREPTRLKSQDRTCGKGGIMRNRAGVEMHHASPESVPTAYTRCGSWGGFPTLAKGLTNAQYTYEPKIGHEVPTRTIVAPTPATLGSRIPWRVSDVDKPKTDANTNAKAGRPKGAKFACTNTTCEWWATKESSTVKHRRKANHQVVKI